MATETDSLLKGYIERMDEALLVQDPAQRLDALISTRQDASRTLQKEVDALNDKQKTNFYASMAGVAITLIGAFVALPLVAVGIGINLFCCFRGHGIVGEADEVESGKNSLVGKIAEEIANTVADHPQESFASPSFKKFLSEVFRAAAAPDEDEDYAGLRARVQPKTAAVQKP